LFDYLVVHGDEDGVCSAAILERFSPGAKILISGPRELIRVLASIPEGSEIAIADVALPRDIKTIEQVALTHKIHYIDHHPLPIGIKPSDLPFIEFDHDLTASASEIVFRKYGDDRADLLAAYGSIGDYMDDTSLMQEILSRHDKRTVYYEAAMIGYALSEKHEQSFSARLARALSEHIRPGYVRGIDELAVAGLRHEYEIYDYVRSHGRPFSGYALVEDPPIVGYAGKAAFYAMKYFGKTVGVCITVKEDWADLVFRSDGAFDVGNFCRTLAAQFGLEGGGHSRAASISVPYHHSEKILTALSQALKRKLPRSFPPPPSHPLF
jgi:RecJ-like exonuclease